MFIDSWFDGELDALAPVVSLKSFWESRKRESTRDEAFGGKRWVAKEFVRLPDRTRRKMKWTVEA
jgi:hypothetical protein